MSKQFINELNRMKDLFGYKRGRVISEQDNQLQKIDDDYLNTKPTGNPDSSETGRTYLYHYSCVAIIFFHSSEIYSSSIY